MTQAGYPKPSASGIQDITSATYLSTSGRFFGWELDLCNCIFSSNHCGLPSRFPAVYSCVPSSLITQSSHVPATVWVVLWVLHSEVVTLGLSTVPPMLSQKSQPTLAFSCFLTLLLARGVCGGTTPTCWISTSSLPTPPSVVGGRGERGGERVRNSRLFIMSPEESPTLLLCERALGLSCSQVCCGICAELSMP